MKNRVKLIVVMLSLLAGAAGAATFPFTANGSWTVPAGVTSITIEVWGGGGGGGGNTTTSDGGGGGGGGAYSRTANIAVTPGEVCTVTIGAGGGGVTGAAGLAGGQSLVSCSGGASVSAAGGAGGSPPAGGGAGGAGGVGGAAGGGTVTFSGGSGGAGLGNNKGQGGPGGSSAGYAANGLSGTDPWSQLTAFTPPAGSGMGIGGDGGDSRQNGLAPASGNGGGGGGSGDKSSVLGTNRTGGNGAGGKAIISYAAPPIVTTTAATALLSDGATLNGIVDDNGADTAIAFEYGLTAAYGSTAVATPSPLPANSGSTAVSAVVSGLVCNTTYHFRATGVNSAGAGYGGDLTFTTAPCPPLVYVFTDSVCQDGVAFGTAGQCALVAWSPRTAGQALGNIYLTRVTLVGGNLVPTRVSTSLRTRTMLFGLSCHDPVANAVVQATLTYQSLVPVTVALPLCKVGGTPPTIGIPAEWSTGVPVTFPARSPSSDYPFSFNYDDVGKVELWINRSGRTDLGYTGPFVVKPAGFALSDIRQTAAPNLVNPAAPDAAGLKFVKAGEAFSVTVTALTASGKAKADAATAINCATIPADCTPNYGNEVSPEGVKLTSALVTGLGLTNNPAIGGTFGAFANGVASGTSFTWGEVGIIKLTPSVGDGDYLGALDVSGTESGNVGRFYPDHLVLSSGVVANRSDLTCAPASTFTYMGEPMSLTLTIVAQNASNGATQNYAGSFAKLDGATASKWTTLGGNDSIGLGAVDGTTALSARLAIDGTPSGSWATGTGTLTAGVVLNRAAAADGAFDNLKLGASPRDADGVMLLPGALDLDADLDATLERRQAATSKVRYGRVRLNNAHGSELLALPLPLKVEYYASSALGFVTNGDDSCTGFLLTPVVNNSPTSYQYGDLLLDNPLVNMTVAASTPTFASNPVNAGQSVIKLSKPGNGKNGSVDLTLTVPAWLQYAWGSGLVPKARATFGVYKGNDEFIYLREAY